MLLIISFTFFPPIFCLALILALFSTLTLFIQMSESTEVPPSMNITPSLKFAPFQSFVDSAFFHELANRKLNDIKLDETEIPIHATYSTSLASNRQPSISVSKLSFQGATQSYQHTTPTEFTSPGSLLGVNTIEGFKSFDKNALLRGKVQQVCTFNFVFVFHTLIDHYLIWRLDLR